MNPEEKKFEFTGYEIDREKAGVCFRYAIKLPDEEIKLEEKLIFPKENFDLEKIPKELLDSLLKNLLLALGIGYWKVYCPQNIILKSFELSKEESNFWNWVYTDGMGEFYFRNKIDFRNLVNFPYNADRKSPDATNFSRQDRSLVSIGGGKDSIVAAEMMKKSGKDFDVIYINQSDVQQKVSDLIGKKKLVVKKIMDEKIFELNKREGVFNGHVPVSLVWAFINLFVAAVYNFRYIIVSNERSANFGNVEYLGKMINHQWSKSFEVEKAFNQYVHKFITPDIVYFSLLRPFSEIKIVEMFSKYKQYFPVFSSCNANFKMRDKLENILWCGHCPKCVFVFTMLSAFLSKDELVKIFGKNLFEDESLIPLFEELLGQKNIKPFECVGTFDEMKLAMKMVSEEEDYKNSKVIKYFSDNVLKNIDKEKLQKELFSFSEENNIPEEFRELLNREQ